MPTQGNRSGAVGLVAQVAAILSLGAGVIHVSAAGDHTNLPVMLVGFIVVAALQIALGAWLFLRRPPRLVIVAGLALMIGSVAAWVVSRTAGLPFLEDGHTEAVGFKDGITVLFEVASIPLLLLLLSPELMRVSVPPRLGHQTFTAVATGCFVLLVPALMLGGGEHHTHEEAVALGLHADDGSHADGPELAHAGADDSSHADEGRDHHKRAGSKHGEKHDKGKAHSGTRHTTTLASADHRHGGNRSEREHTDRRGHERGDDHGKRDHERDRPGGKGHGRHRGDRDNDDDHGDGGGQPGNPVEELIADVVSIVQPPADPRR